VAAQELKTLVQRMKDLVGELSAAAGDSKSLVRKPRPVRDLRAETAPARSEPTGNAAQPPAPRSRKREEPLWDGPAAARRADALVRAPVKPPFPAGEREPTPSGKKAPKDIIPFDKDDEDTLSRF